MNPSGCRPNRSAPETQVLPRSRRPSFAPRLDGAFGRQPYGSESRSSPRTSARSYILRRALRHSRSCNQVAAAWIGRRGLRSSHSSTAASSREEFGTPVEVIAERTGTPTETIRAWVHRARNEGYLPPWKGRPGANRLIGRCWLCEGSGLMRCPRRDRLEKEVSGDPESSAESIVLALLDHYCDDEDFATGVNRQATSSSLGAHKAGPDDGLMECPRCGRSGVGPRGARHVQGRAVPKVATSRHESLR